ncbi:hypothetical protein C2L98_08150 [Enterococcus gallinarum]|nr:hypothetical protein C2L98_08150 [Enterococcus gallinarum]
MPLLLLNILKSLYPLILTHSNIKKQPSFPLNGLFWQTLEKMLLPAKASYPQDKSVNYFSKKRG